MTDENIDWRQIWDDLNWDDEHQQVVMQERLKKRAQQYAQSDEDATDRNLPAQTVLSFDLGTETYAIDVMLVREVRALSRITPVPGTPAFYRGVVNIRGKIITALDLRAFFDIEADPRRIPGELIVVRAEVLEVGFLAHHVRDVVTLPENQIEPMDDLRYVTGMGPGRLVLLDAAHMLDDERLIVGGVDER